MRPNECESVQIDEIQCKLPPMLKIGHALLSTNFTTFYRLQLALVVLWYSSGLISQRWGVQIQAEVRGGSRTLIRGGPQIVTGLKLPFWWPQFYRILVLGPHFWWSGGGGPRGPPPGSAPGG